MVDRRVSDSEGTFGPSSSRRIKTCWAEGVVRQREGRAAMPTSVTDRVPKRQDVASDRDLVQRVAARSLTIAVDPTSRTGSGVQELALLAGHDRSVLGRAWLVLVVPALRSPTAPVVAAERLLSAALESEGLDERVHVDLAS